MSLTPLDLPVDSIPLVGGLGYGIPVALLSGSFLAGRAQSRERAWRIASWTTSLTAVLALAVVVVLLADWAASGESIRATASGRDLWWSLVLLLVAGLGWMLPRYSRTYLHGEPEQRQYVRSLLATLAGSSLVVVTDHLLVLAVAWLGTSLSLQQLLLFYPERPAAALAARKKFVVSRTADLSLLSAIVLFGWQFGTLQIDELAAQIAVGEVGGAATIGVVLIAVAALLKSAQLPFHGWLIQVMEAPTPVSALLHAGVVNLGGFVLIRTSGLISAVPAAQWLLVIVGTLTAVLAALIATTRVSVKVALAWSTCAQMGFMMLQCGLGLYEMALLHLLAHSLYKAHAFLSAGDTVRQARIRQLAPEGSSATVGGWALGTVTAGLLVFVAMQVFGVGWTERPALATAAFILTLAIAHLLRPVGSARFGGLWWRGAFRAAAIAVAYLGAHSLMEPLIPVAAELVPTAPIGIHVVVVVAFGWMFVTHVAVSVWPNGRWARSLHPWLFGGFYLDEWFTRLVLRIRGARQLEPSAAAAKSMGRRSVSDPRGVS